MDENELTKEEKRDIAEFENGVRLARGLQAYDRLMNFLLACGIITIAVCVLGTIAYIILNP
jgi:hypothetical protein